MLLGLRERARASAGLAHEWAVWWEAISFAVNRFPNDLGVLFPDLQQWEGELFSAILVPAVPALIGAVFSG